MLKRITAVFVVVASVSSCQKDAAPLVATSFAAASATTLAPTVVGNVVPTVPTVEFKTASGKSVKNMPMSVVVTAGGGSIVGSPTQSVAGPTPIGNWTLGPTAGVQTVRVTSVGFAPIFFTVTATPDVPAELIILEGDDQRAPENGTIPLPIRVQVQDQHDNGVPGVTVTWAVDAGGGDLPGATTSQTDDGGIATAPAWVLGANGSGEQALTANAAGLTEVRFTAEVQEPAASITIEADAPAEAAVGSSLSPTFAVRDAEGNILNGVPVTFSITAGGGSINDAPTVSAAGATSVGNWVLGTSPSAQALTVEVAGVPSIVFNTDAVTGPAAIIDAIAGEGQSADPGADIVGQIRVKVTDAFDNPITGTTVNWSVSQGGGLIGGTTSMTDGLGETDAPSWTLGNCGGLQALRATVGAAQGDVPATANPNASGLEVYWLGAEPGGAVQAAFDNACLRMRQVIVDSLEPVALNEFESGTCTGSAVVTGRITGLRIYARVEDIDGTGGVLGSAGPCYIRNTGSELPILGQMRFDSADMATMVGNGSITRVILHEMMHVFGIGTMWNFFGLMTGQAPDTIPPITLPFFTGALATTACVDDHGGATPCSTGVPIEDCLGTGIPASCGAGTINAHWKESVFRTELMTGYLSGGTNPFSKMTMQSLADLGYTVSFASADAYTIPPASLMSELQAWFIKMPAPTLPVGRIDRNGNLVERRF